MRVRVMVEMRRRAVSAEAAAGAQTRRRDSDDGNDVDFLEATAARFQPVNLEIDRSFRPVPTSAGRVSGGDEETGQQRNEPQRPDVAEAESVIVRGLVEESDIEAVEGQPDVIRVWRDTPIAFFTERRRPRKGPGVQMVDAHLFGACPIPPCDCGSAQAKGTIADVAEYLGVDRVWDAGITGAGIVVGIVDTGITAIGRPVDPSEDDVDLVPNVIGGFPTDDWGTTGSYGGWHGNMTATDVLGMAPEASIYDIRIASNYISDAIAGYDWAIAQHRRDGTPHILSNSWGIFQEIWDPVYANDPNHPFTRKVVDALDEGILVVFSAGNCGARCPDGRCGDDTGPGRSIWGANGHPRVMTVGAANIEDQLIGYSSQGPAALDDTKPDFCSISHFEGYFDSDSGTSAAAPIAAGVVALLKQALPTLDQDLAKHALMTTAQPLGRPKWNPHAGAGIIQAKDAYEYLPIPAVEEDRQWIAPVLHAILA